MSVGFGSDGTVESTLESSGVPLQVELVNHPTVSHLGDAKQEGVREVDILYTSILEYRSEIDTLNAEITNYKVT